MFATSVGLLMNALERNGSNNDNGNDKVLKEDELETDAIDNRSNSEIIYRKSILEKWGDKLKEFLDNA